MTKVQSKRTQTHRIRHNTSAKQVDHGEECRNSSWAQRRLACPEMALSLGHWRCVPGKAGREKRDQKKVTTTAQNKQLGQHKLFHLPSTYILSLATSLDQLPQGTAKNLQILSRVSDNSRRSCSICLNLSGPICPPLRTLAGSLGA